MKFLEVEKDKDGSTYIEGRIADGTTLAEEVFVQVFLPRRISAEEDGYGTPILEYGAEHIIFDEVDIGVEGPCALLWSVVAWCPDGQIAWGADAPIGDLEINLSQGDVRVTLYCATI